MKKFEHIAKSKEFYSAHLYTCLLYSTINILFYFLNHIFIYPSILLSIQPPIHNIEMLLYLKSLSLYILCLF